MRKKKIGIVLITISLLILPNFVLMSRVTADEEFYNINVDKAYHMIKNFPNLVVLDVRDSIDYNLGHLYNAISIPLDDLEERISELEEYKDRKIIIYCRFGYRSQLASEVLYNNGFAEAYNMLGGILAWIDAEYPIWTTSHHITIDNIRDKKFKLQIDPLLLYYSGSPTCSEDNECPDDDAIELTFTVLEQEEDYIKVLTIYESNGIAYEYISTQTILWQYSNTRKEFIETAYFISSTITGDNVEIQSYQFKYLKQHDKYNLTIYTHLNPLNTEIYDRAYTFISYTPVEGKHSISMEIIQFNEPVLLSQKFMILGKIADKMAKVYRHSEDKNIKKLSYAYKTMANEINSVSRLVKENLWEFDLQVLESSAVLVDYQEWGDGGGGGGGGGGGYLTCFVCQVACDLAILVGCVLACDIYPPFCPVCEMVVDLWDLFDLGCGYVCEWLGFC